MSRTRTSTARSSAPRRRDDTGASDARPSRPERAASLAMFAALVALALARLAASLGPGAWGWGVASLRDVPPVSWALWALACALLAPPLARPLLPALETCGDAWTARGARAWLASAAFAAVLAGVALALPDRGGFVGDFLLRLGIVRRGVPYSTTFPQALPLDVLLHERLVALVAARTGADPFAIERALGALRAAALAGAGVLVARALGRRGAAAALAAIGVAFTGALALCTGYGKGLADLALVVALVFALSLRLAREGRGAAALALAVAAGVALHRSGLVLLAPWATALAVARARGLAPLASVRARLAQAAPPLAALLVASRIGRALAGVDREHLAPGGADFARALANTFAPARLLDRAEVVVLLAPLALVALAVVLAAPRRPRAGDAALGAANVAPWLAVLLLVSPRQGVVRDWDVFTPAAVAIAAASAWALGTTLARGPSRKWLAPALAMAAIAPTAALLLRAHDVPSSLAFAQRALDGPPVRSAIEAANLHHYRATVLARDGHLREGAAEFRRAAEQLPSPSHLTLWLNSALLANDVASARDALVHMIEREPTPERWLMLSRAEHALGRLPEAIEAVRRALALAPADSACVAWAGALGVTPDAGADATRGR